MKKNLAVASIWMGCLWSGSHIMAIDSRNPDLYHFSSYFLYRVRQLHSKKLRLSLKTVVTSNFEERVQYRKGQEILINPPKISFNISHLLCFDIAFSALKNCSTSKVDSNKNLRLLL
jgi:hypothetical protein